MVKRLRITTLLCCLLFAILIGIALSKIAPISTPGWLSLMIGPAVLIAWKRRTWASSVLAIVFGVSIGLWRGGVFLPRIAPYQELAQQKVTVQVKAESSAVYNETKQLEFDASDVHVLSPYDVRVPGMMVISGFGENSVLRGDVVTVSGKLHTRRGGKQAGISFGQLHVESRSSSALEKVRRDFLAGLNTALPEPHGQFAAGILIGQRSTLPDDVSDMLRTVGLSHVIAVSGYNLTIMAEVARRRFGKKSKYRTTLMSAGLILLFVAIAGSSASIARAAFVSLLSLFAAHYGRTVKPLLLLLLAAAYTAYVNPLNLWTDIGWYLSFLAFFGVLIVAPAVTGRFFAAKDPNPVVKLLIETSSAQLMTVPIVLFIFGEVSLISLIANLLVVPLVPVAMLLSLIAGVAGMLVPLSAGVIAWPAKMLLSFMLQLSSLLARVPHALSELQISAGVMLLLYAAVIGAVIIMKRKTPKYAKILAD